VASKSNRQRRLERQRTERRMAKRAEHARRKRRIQAGVGGAVALILVALGTTWLLGGFDSKPSETVALPSCTWTPKQVQPSAGVDDTGLPPSDAPHVGVETITMQTNLGDIKAVIDLTQAPCAGASMKYLGGRGFYDGTRCHHLDTAQLTLTCGSKTADGNSSPGYQFPAEGLPRQPIGTAAPLTPGASPSPSASPTPSYYAKGSIVMANTDTNATGAQFFIVYGDGSDLPAEYTQVGTITTGLDLVEQIAAGGAVDASGAPAPAGNPVKDLTITKLSVEDQLSLNPSGSPSPETPASPEATASASPSS
jgi:peptidyl-prolyl cis-trans isomerase B (cyclophilin B)